MYPTHNEGKSVVAETFIRTLKTNFINTTNTTSVSNNAYIDKLDDIVNKYNNTYEIKSTIKMKPADVKSSINTDSSKKNHDKDPKFKIGDIVRMSECKNIFGKGYATNWSEEVFVIKKVKNTVPLTYVFSHLSKTEIVWTFHKKELQKKDYI